MTVTTPEDRMTALQRNLTISADLIGPDIETGHPEYIRALSEYTCMASGISTDYKETVEDLSVQFAQTFRSDRSVATFMLDLESSIDLIDPSTTPEIAENSEYVRGLSEHACLAGNISPEHAPSVRALLMSIFANN